MPAPSLHLIEQKTFLGVDARIFGKLNHLQYSITGFLVGNEEKIASYSDLGAPLWSILEKALWQTPNLTLGLRPQQIFDEKWSNAWLKNFHFYQREAVFWWRFGGFYLGALSSPNLQDGEFRFGYKQFDARIITRPLGKSEIFEGQIKVEYTLWNPPKIQLKSLLVGTTQNYSADFTACIAWFCLGALSQSAPPAGIGSTLPALPWGGILGVDFDFLEIAIAASNNHQRAKALVKFHLARLIWKAGIAYEFSAQKTEYFNSLIYEIIQSKIHFALHMQYTQTPYTQASMGWIF